MSGFPTQEEKREKKEQGKESGIGVDINFICMRIYLINDDINP